MNPDADLSDLGDATPENWLCSSCSMHDNNNILKKFLKNLSQEMIAVGESNFDAEYKKIESCINSADSRKERKNNGCAKSLNDFLLDSEVQSCDKTRIARILDDNFDLKNEQEKSSFMEQITKFQMIKPVFKVRFRSMTSGLRSILIAKPII